MSQADVAVLRALRGHAPGPVTAADLSRRAALTAPELAIVIGELRASGYDIEERADVGYTFRSAPDRLIGDDVRAGLDENVRIGREIIVLEQTSSTNDFLLQMAAPEVGEGLVVFAESQTAGRGQRGNRWSSAQRQGLWLSILLRPEISVAESSRLTTWIAQGVADSIAQELSVIATVKAPNDVYAGNRKVAGVLVEMRAAGKSHIAIAGIGINLNQQLHDFPAELRERAGSLAMVTGKRIDRRDFAVAVLRNLDRTYRETFAP